MRFGAVAELFCSAVMFFAGYHIIKRNYALPGGEIDLIASREDLLVFVEVRLRTNPSFGSGLDSVDIHKQQRIIHTALGFLGRHPAYLGHRCRFDVMSISRRHYFPRLQWTRNAFTHDDDSTVLDSAPGRTAFSLRLLQ
jgi:putative endonuclease